MTRKPPLRIRRRVLFRAGHRCQVCHQRRQLDLHHLVPVSRGGDHGADNLICLCRPCHLRVHRQRQLDREHHVDQVTSTDN